ncbi:hypothetical protein [Arthrobacter sp. ISL-30]|uniref:hypothetical protein n=1 Tax=Arthrobacter sp. ISL-30 TaxID=2819109 RepID=UPI001BE57B50|nr:hypothetical protein [Arthrobacter sp. ISL-30]MBT2512485.1 hypothetical protein [Arthrobacter sp. ISL-30]
MRTARSAELPPLDRQALKVLTAISRAPSMAILRTLDGGSWHTHGEISEALSLSAEDVLPHLLALQGMGVIQEEHGRFGLDKGILKVMLGQTYVSAVSA